MSSVLLADGSIWIDEYFLDNPDARYSALASQKSKHPFLTQVRKG